MRTHCVDTLCPDTLLERPRYFPRQLMTPEEMTLAQQYILDKLRRHNRLMHGWGIVCGARVSRVPKDDDSGDFKPWGVYVEPGYALDSHGYEILINEKVCHDVRSESSSKDKLRDGKHVDPWCTDVTLDRPPADKLYLVVCYDECETRPVRVSPNGCGCDGAECEYSRIRDSFIIKTVTKLPESHRNLAPAPDFCDCRPCDLTRECPECWDDRCLVLATLDVNENGIQHIDCYTHRRYAWSLANYYYQCSPLDSAAEASVADAMRYMRLLVKEEAIEEVRDIHSGAIGAFVGLPATALRGLSSTSEVGEIMKSLTIGEIASMSLDEFSSRADELLADVGEPQKRYFEGQKELLWTRAVETERRTRGTRMP